MIRLKPLSGEEVVGILKTFDFTQISQRGSHVKLQRVVEGSRQTLTIPLHPELDRGTLKAIVRQTTRYIPENELRPYFYSE